MGDLNLNPTIPNEMRRLNELCQYNNFHMHLKEDTTRNHNHIDHILVHRDIQNRVFTTAFCNFVSDHKSIVIRVADEGNTFTDDAKQKISHAESLKLIQCDDIDFNVSWHSYITIQTHVMS